MVFGLGYLFNFFSEVQMYTHLRFSFCIVILLLTFSTALKEQLTFLKYLIQNKASSEIFKLFFKIFLFCITWILEFFLLAWVYFVFYFDLNQKFFVC